MKKIIMSLALVIIFLVSGGVVSVLGDVCDAQPDGTLCDDNNACTLNDQCVGGICGGDADAACNSGLVCDNSNFITINESC